MGHGHGLSAVDGIGRRIRLPRLETDATMHRTPMRADVAHGTGDEDRVGMARLATKFIEPGSGGGTRILPDSARLGVPKRR